MPRRSARVKANEEQKDMEICTETADHSDLQSELKSTKSIKNTPITKSSNKQSVSNNNSSDPTTTEQKEQSLPASAESSIDPIVTTSVKRLSIDPETALPPLPPADNDIEMENIAEDEEENALESEGKTLAESRTRRRRNIISYKDESSSSDDDMQSESENSEGANPIFMGLSKAERIELRNRMSGIQNEYSDAIRKERELKLEEIICSFEFNIGQKISNECAGFIYDFCRKHQFDVNEKIEDEGEFFLENMKEMMDEKRKQVANGIRKSRNNKKKKGGDDSESEFDLNEYDCDDDSDSEFSYSDWENPDVDNENMIESDDEFGAAGRYKKKRKRNKNIWRDPKTGREYAAKGRLLLDDALKDTENFEGWSAARVQAYKNKSVNPNAYYYRFNDVGEPQKNGPVLEEEHETFMKRIMEVGTNTHWGTFSMKIPGRVGYQCSNYWRQMMKDGWVKDPNYWIKSDGKFAFKRAKKGSIPDAIRKYSFIVVKDPSKTFSPLPAYHPKRPSDKALKKYLQDGVRDFVEKKKTKKNRTTKNSNKNNTNNKEEKEEEVEENNSNNKEEIEEDKKVKKTKKKKGKKGSDNSDESEGDNDKKKSKKKKGKKSKKKKDKKSKKKDKKSKKKNKKSKDGNDSSEGKKSKKKKDKKSKKKKDKKGKKKDSEMDIECDAEIEGSGEETTDSSSSNNSKRNKKRKRNENGEVSQLEPPQKKRKKMKNKKKKEEKENESKLEMILGGMIDIMTGEAMSQPAISPYGYVMEYNSWCSILRNKRTKNKCPFTQQKMTRRGLVKLDENNIEEYKDKIINISDDDIKKFKQSS